MIKNIVFDIGNVLLSFEPSDYLSRAIKDPEIADDLNTRVFRSAEWLMLDKGTITKAQAAERILQRDGRHADLVRQLLESWMELLTPIDASIKLLTPLKQAGYRLYYLSNFHTVAYETILRKNAFFQCFDGGIVSCEVNCIKPEQEIYAHLLQKYGLKAQECLFLDDVEVNVKAAAALGFQTIHLTDAGIIQSLLAQHGVNF